MMFEENQKYKIIQGDSLEQLKQIGTGEVDCIFTSPNPPTSMNGVNEIVKILGNAYRVVKPNGSMFLHSEDYYDDEGSLVESASMLSTLLHFWKWMIRGKMIWYMRQRTIDPTNVQLINRDYELVDRNRFRQDYTYIYHFTQARYGYYFDEALRAFTNSSIFEEEYVQPKITETYTGFSENLIALCLTLGCKPGGTVLDPFAGYGTTGVVALKLGYKFIGIDKDPTRIQPMKERLYSVKV